MKDDKICFSKTLTYLVLLVAVVFGAFWMMNYTNSQKVGGTPKASERNITICPIYNGSRTGGSDSDRYVAATVGAKCYGNTGIYDSAKVNTTTLELNSRGELTNRYNSLGCLLTEIKCQFDRYGKKERPASGSEIAACPANSFVWTPNSIPTGFAVFWAKNDRWTNPQYYAYKEVCTRRKGTVQDVWLADLRSHTYTPSYRCVLSKEGVSEWDCTTRMDDKNPNKIPTPVTITNGRTTNNSTDGKYEFGDFCPDNLIVWRSYYYGKDATQLDWKGVTKAPGWDICMRLTGEGQAIKDPATGVLGVRCIAQKAPSGKECNAVWRWDPDTGLFSEY